MKALSFLLILSLTSWGLFKKHKEKTEQSTHTQSEMEIHQESIDLLPIKVPGQVQTFLFHLDSLQQLGMQQKSIGPMSAKLAVVGKHVWLETSVDSTEVHFPRKTTTKVSINNQTSTHTKAKTTDTQGPSVSRFDALLRWVFWTLIIFLVIYFAVKKRSWLWSLFARFL
jgi:hypothetical protein